MDIELLNANGDVITRLSQVKNPEGNFNNIWKAMFGATSWRGYVPPMMAIPTLSDVITESLQMIDASAGKTRYKYITSVPGQDATYRAKRQDAEAYKAAGYPADATPYPWVSAEATATGNTPQVAADNILATVAAWTTKGSQIEGERIKGKTAVKLAATIPDALTIRNTTIRNIEAM